MEQRKSLQHDGDAWVTEYLTYARAYGGQQPEPFCVPSVANLTKFYNTAAKLASGEGITCNYRGGAFDEGMLRTVASLHVPYVAMHTRGTPQPIERAPTHPRARTWASSCAWRVHCTHMHMQARPRRCSASSTRPTRT